MPGRSRFSKLKTAEDTASNICALIGIIDNGTGDEWLTLNDLKLTGSHPFSNSTRRRKIERHEYPAPVKLSPQMCVWRASEIRAWRQNPTSYQAPKSAAAINQLTRHVDRVLPQGGAQ